MRDLGESFPGIERDLEVAGGEACIVRTRIPVWTLVRARQLGTTEATSARFRTTRRLDGVARLLADETSLFRSPKSSASSVAPS